MITALYILFFISLLAPIYTYAVYPIILKLLPKKKYVVDEEYTPHVSTVISSDASDKLTGEKAANLKQLDYPADRIEYLAPCSCGIGEFDLPIGNCLNDDRASKAEIVDALLKAAKGDVIIITDEKTPVDSESVRNLIKHFADKRVGCVVGQMCNEIASAFWKYENFVRVHEGEIGRVSGVNKTLYAIRKGVVTSIPLDIINLDFYIATAVQQNGYDVVFEKDAVAYEKTGTQRDYTRDGSGHYQALNIFWRMLLPRKGSFVFWSHRVMKWLVPFDMIMAFVISGLLGRNSRLMLTLFVLQVLFYMSMATYYFLFAKKDKKAKSKVGKLLSLMFYFIFINTALFFGWLRYISGKQNGAWERRDREK